MALQWKEILRSDGDLKGKVDGEDVGDIKSGSQAGTTAKGVTDAAFDSNVLKEANAHANLKNSGISISAAGVLSGANVGGGTVTGAGLDVIMRDGTGAPDILKNDEITLTSANGTVTLNNAGSGSIGKPDLGLGNVLDQAQTSTFRQDAIPTALAAGDLWIDTNDNNKSYVATAAGDDAVTSGEWEEVTISKATVGLASVEDKAISTCGWGDIGIAKTDVSSSDVGLGSVVNQAVTVVGNKLKFGSTVQTLDADKIGGSTLAETKAAAVTTATSNIIGDAPDALNTLNELAAALGDDASYASTVTTALGARQMGHVGMTAADTPAATSYSVGRTGTFGGVMYMVVDE